MLRTSPSVTKGLGRESVGDHIYHLASLAYTVDLAKRATALAPSVYEVSRRSTAVVNSLRLTSLITWASRTTFGTVSLCLRGVSLLGDGHPATDAPVICC